jgi:hypothetical protein
MLFQFMLGDARLGHVTSGYFRLSLVSTRKVRLCQVSPG